MGARRRGLLYDSFGRRGRPAHDDRESRGLTMTRVESSETETAWTSGQAAARRKALTDAGLERPVAEALVDLLDEQAAPMMTRAEADARFAAMLERQDVTKAEADARFAAMLDRQDAAKAEADARFAAMLDRQDAAKAEADARFTAMLDRHDAQRAQDRAEFRGEMEARFARVDARFAELKGEMDARFGEVNGRFGSVDAQIEGLAGQMGTLKWTFGSLMAFNTLLLAVLTYTVAT